VGGGPKSIARVLFTIVCGICVVSGLGSGQSGGHGPKDQRADPGRGIHDRAELEAFFDSLMVARLRDHHVAGAVVAVVKDSLLVLAKGYGYADVDARKPVDPERTLFRIGSVTKLFTWTAVMELAESGRLNLNRDVNDYIDFRIPRTYPQPITLTHLMTHTAGLEADDRDAFTDNPADLGRLGAWVRTHLPGRVREPGTFASYSNYGANLAGYIVERASGIGWSEYIEQRILGPLAMQQTTGRQPPAAMLASELSKGYVYQGGHFVPKDFELLLGGQASGGMSASATDMARFMLAHLANGRLGDQRILAESTAIRMHSRAFGHDARIPGFALGFYEESSHGLRIISHGGDTRLFHTELALIPEERVGVFVSSNTDTGSELSSTFLKAFLDHYYPLPADHLATTQKFANQAARFVGTYASNRRSYTTYQKALGLFGGVSVHARDDGTLLWQWPFRGLPMLRLVQVDTMLFRDAIGEARVAFRADASGRVTHAFVGPTVAFERLAWYQTPRLHRLVLRTGLVVFLSVVVAAAFQAFRRRRPADPPSRVLVLGRRVLVGIAACNLAFVAIMLAMMSWSPSRLYTSPLTELKITLALPVLAGLLTVVAGTSAILQWKGGLGTVGTRLRYSGAVLITLLFLWSLNYWNLLGWCI